MENVGYTYRNMFCFINWVGVGGSIKDIVKVQA